MTDNSTAHCYFQPRRIAHVNYVVSDLNRLMDFYIEILGIEEVYRTPETSAGFVSNGNTHHDIGVVDISGDFAKSIDAQVGLYHFGYEIETEAALVEGYHRSVADHVQWVKTRTHDVAHSVYGMDPDGITFELYADVTKDWRNRRKGTVTKKKPVWTPGCTPPITEPCYHVDPLLSRVEHALFHPQRFKSATLVATHSEAMIDTYTRIAGMRVLHGGADGEFCVLGGSLGEANLYLFRARPGRPAGLHHVALPVADIADLRASIAKAPAVGIELEQVIDHPLRLSAYVCDPDGNRFQLYADKQPVAAPLSAEPEAVLWIG